MGIEWVSGMMSFLRSAGMYAGVALCFLVGEAHASDTTRIWRVCLGDAAVPPYLYNDPLRLGIIERILNRAGSEIGFSTTFLRYPTQRCRAMLESGAVDAWIVAPTSGNLAAFQFPMKGGAVDFSRRIVRINLVWIKRPDNKLEWTNGKMSGSSSSSIVVGARAGLQSVKEPLEKMNFTVDDKAISTHQLLQKLQRGRVDIAVALQEEVEVAMHDPTLQDLVVLQEAMTTAVYFMGVRQNLSPDLRDQVESWWTSIGKLRDSPEFQFK